MIYEPHKVQGLRKEMSSLLNRLKLFFSLPSLIYLLYNIKLCGKVSEILRVDFFNFFRSFMISF